MRRFVWQESILANLDADALAEDEKEAIEMYQQVASMIYKYGQNGG